MYRAGLRGAMAFALALSSVEDLPGGHGKVMFTTTTAIVVLTVRLLLSTLTSSLCILIFLTFILRHLQGVFRMVLFTRLRLLGCQQRHSENISFRQHLLM
jgi:hypothetical protein